MAASDLASYAQGYIFDDSDTDLWDSANTRFLDQSGYGAHLKISTGTANFQTVDTYRGLKLDNTFMAPALCQFPGRAL